MDNDFWICKVLLNRYSWEGWDRVEKKQKTCSPKGHQQELLTYLKCLFQLLSHKGCLGVDKFASILHLHQKCFPWWPDTLFHFLLLSSQLSVAHADNLCHEIFCFILYRESSQPCKNFLSSPLFTVRLSV